jgi:hypothetical protein
MRYAVYLGSEVGAFASWNVDNDFFCVLDSIEEVESQVHEFISWEPDDDLDTLTFERKSALLRGENVTLKGALSAICIRPIREAKRD